MFQSVICCTLISAFAALPQPAASAAENSTTETKEQLMERARLMQQTLAQFDIEVSLGDITKGPTITRYELHPAPGVKLEKMLSPADATTVIPCAAACCHSS